MSNTATKLTKSDFETDQEVRWCPGCGDYSVLAAVQKLLPSLNIPREQLVFVSGIGCSSRFPYYMNTYGFHTIHGRAPAVATGVKVTNPALSVWVITGDGDALSIGGNHFIHLLRRNVDLNILLFNNRIYGLTKGQYSPTSEVGKVTKSTPMGSADFPLNPILVALGAQGTFIARAVDRDAAQLADVLTQAAAHKGTSFVEIYQNCNIFNDGAFDYVAERANRSETQLQLLHGKPLIFGKERNKGLAIGVDAQAKIVNFAGGESEALSAGIAVYDKHNANLANILARLDYPEFPVPMGVFFQSERTSFNDALDEQRNSALRTRPLTGSVDDNLRELFQAGDTWVVS